MINHHQISNAVKKFGVSTMGRGLTLLILVVSLTACGFHLRGNIPLPDGIKNMYVAAPEGTFKDQLEEVLIRAGANLAVSEGSADVILNVSEAVTDRTVGTLDARGKASSYTLRFKVRYRLEDLEGVAIRPVASLSESRRYDFDPEFVVESEAEEDELQEDMEESISLRIVRKLSSVTNYPSNEELSTKEVSAKEQTSSDEAPSEE